MNNPNKKIDVSSASLIGLKAELHRKAEAFKLMKIKAESGTREPKIKSKKKPNVWAKENEAALEAAQQSLSDKHEEEDLLQKSKKALEAKTLLYEKMSKEMISDEDKELYVVDFQRKVLNTEKENQLAEKNAGLNVCSTATPENASVKIDLPSSPDEWVDFVDCLGRSRRCLRDDLPRFKKIDEDLRPKPNPIDETAKWEEDNSLLSQDMKNELERRRWEDEEVETIEEPTGPIHYQNVQHEEVRDHGVGYYGFSTEELERKKQMDILNEFRKQTENQRNQRDKLKERRKALLEARLAKVKQRKNVKLGIEESDHSDSNISEDEKDDATKAPETDSPPATDSKPSNAKATKVRPWDEGKVLPPAQRKKTKWTQEQWIEEQRTERNTDFAPPQFYYEGAAGRRKGFNWTGFNPNAFASPIPTSINPTEATQSEHFDVTKIPVPEETVDKVFQPEEANCPSNVTEHQIDSVLAYFKMQTTGNDT